MLAQLDVSEVYELYHVSGEIGEPRSLFKYASLRRKVFAGLILHCSDWIECDLSGAIFRECDLRGADFSLSSCSDVRFERCSMYACELPDDDSIQMIGCLTAL